MQKSYPGTNSLKRPMEGELDQAYQNQFDGPPEAKRSVPDTNSSSATFTDVNGQELTTEEYPVPDNMVGLIIGRGGDQITKIQADTGCRVAVVPQPTGSVTRPCTLTGTTEQILVTEKNQRK